MQQLGFKRHSGVYTVSTLSRACVYVMRSFHSILRDRGRPFNSSMNIYMRTLPNSVDVIGHSTGRQPAWSVSCTQLGVAGGWCEDAQAGMSLDEPWGQSNS